LQAYLNRFTMSVPDRVRIRDADDRIKEVKGIALPFQVEFILRIFQLLAKCGRKRPLPAAIFPVADGIMANPAL
jgi:hypothetical protein